MHPLKLRINSTVFEEFEMSVVELAVANAEQRFTKHTHTTPMFNVIFIIIEFSNY